MNSIDFQEKIAYCFKDPSLLEKALTHSSYIKERENRAEKNNERLEFLGDAFFDAVISEELYRRMPKVEEGTLTKIRSKIVCEKSLAEKAEMLDVGEYIRMGHGEERSGGRHRSSIIADAMEAVIAAIYLDGEFAAAKKFILAVFGDTITKAIQGRLYNDYKTEIQEKLQLHGEADITYDLISADGPDHDKTFHVRLLFNGNEIGLGVGKSKKEAEQQAAREALERGGKLVL